MNIEKDITEFDADEFTIIKKEIRDIQKYIDNEHSDLQIVVSALDCIAGNAKAAIIRLNPYAEMQAEKMQREKVAEIRELLRCSNG